MRSRWLFNYADIHNSSDELWCVNDVFFIAWSYVFVCRRTTAGCQEFCMSEWKSQQLHHSSGDSLIRLHISLATHVDCWDLISSLDMRKKIIAGWPCHLISLCIAGETFQLPVEVFLFSVAMATVVFFRWLPDIFPQCLLPHLQLSVLQSACWSHAFGHSVNSPYTMSSPLSFLRFTWTAASCVSLDVFICPKCFRLSRFGLDALPFPFIFSSFVLLPLF